MSKCKSCGKELGYAIDGDGDTVIVCINPKCSENGVII